MRPQNLQRTIAAVIGVLAAVVAVVGCGSSNGAASHRSTANRGPATTLGAKGHASVSAGASEQGFRSGNEKSGQSATDAGGGPSGSDGHGSSAAAGSRPASGSGAGSRSSAGSSGGSPGTSGSSPSTGRHPRTVGTLPERAVVPVMDTARASVQEVVLLHDVAVGLAHPNGLPGNPAATQAARLVEQFTAQHATLVGLAEASPLTAAAYELTDALSAYSTLAESVHSAAIANVQSVAVEVRRETRCSRYDLEGRAQTDRLCTACRSAGQPGSLAHAGWVFGDSSASSKMSVAGRVPPVAVDSCSARWCGPEGGGPAR